MKIRPVGAELFHADWQTYDEAISHLFAILQTRVKTAYAALSYDHIYKCIKRYASLQLQRGA